MQEWSCPITKHSFIVQDVAALAKTLRRAFRIAKTGRPGPVLVDITKDVTANKTEFYPCCSKGSEAICRGNHTGRSSDSSRYESIKRKSHIFL